MTTDHPKNIPGQDQPVQLPALRQPFGRAEVADWWDTIEGRMASGRRPRSAPLRRPVLALLSCSVLLVGGVALAVSWPHLAPRVLAPLAPAAGGAPASPGTSLPTGSGPRGARQAASTAASAPASAASEPAASAPASAASEPAPVDSAAPATMAPTGASGPGPLTPSAASAPAASASAPAASASGPRPWRELARRGAFGDAYTELGATGGVARAATAASVDDLFALADVARLSGHPREAVAPLSQIVQRGGGQAALAAFTLGRLRLDQLGETAAAAQDFERAVALGLGGALREDALVRRITALARSGQTDQAREAAVSYAALFPASRRRVAAWLPKDE